MGCWQFYKKNVNIYYISIYILYLYIYISISVYIIYLYIFIFTFIFIYLYIYIYIYIYCLYSCIYIYTCVYIHSLLAISYSYLQFGRPTPPGTAHCLRPHSKASSGGPLRQKIPTLRRDNSYSHGLLQLSCTAQWINR